MDSLIARLNAGRVRYIVIGGQAVRLLGLPRFTMDWDLFVPPRDADNFARIDRALGTELDCEVEPLGSRGENVIQTYQTSWGVLQFHLAVPGLPGFDVAAARAQVAHEDGEPIHVLAPAKLAANRPQDQQDILFLRALMSRGA